MEFEDWKRIVVIALDLSEKKAEYKTHKRSPHIIADFLKKASDEQLQVYKKLMAKRLQLN